MRQVRHCARCGRGPLRDKRDRSVGSRWRHYGRGLDGYCYQVERLAGRLQQWDRRNRSLAEIRADYETEYALFGDLMARSLSEAAARVGLSPSYLDQALRRTGLSWRAQHRSRS